MASNKLLFGNFSQGCRLWIREAPNIIIGLDTDDLTKNKVTILGEGRFAVTVEVPTYFTVVNLA